MRIQTSFLGILRQVDTNFITKIGQLKLQEINNESAQLITYVKGHKMQPMKSDYALPFVDNPTPVKNLHNKLLGAVFSFKSEQEMLKLNHSYVDYLNPESRKSVFSSFEPMIGLDSEGK